VNEPLKAPDTVGLRVPISHLLWFLLVLLLCYWSYMAFVREQQWLYENPEFAMWQYNHDSVRAGRQQSLKLLALGDSSIKAGFIPALAGAETENLALGGSTPIVGYFTLRDYLANNPAPEKLVITYTPYHLAKQDAFWERAVRYRYLGGPDYAEVLAIARSLEDPVLGDIVGWKYRWNPATYAAALRDGIRKRRWRLYPGEYQALQRSAGHRYFGEGKRAIRANAEARMADFAASPLLDHYLRKMVGLAVDAGIETYWFTAPMPRFSCERLSSGFDTAYREYLRDIARLGIVAEGGVACWDDELFGDSAHLHSGSARFSKTVLERLGLPYLGTAAAMPAVEGD
jgi:hypothetical protein